jgi:hypothetical protein
MAQVNVNEPRRPTYADESADATTPAYEDAGDARAAATNNLTWALAVVLIIAAIVIALVYLTHNVHF